MATPQQKLVAATNQLAKYYGLPVVEDLLNAEALKAIVGQSLSANPLGADKLLSTLLASFINSSSGALTSKNLIDKLNEITKGTDAAALQERLNKVLEIYFSNTNLLEGTTGTNPDGPHYRPGIKAVLENVTGNINSKEGDPSKEAPNISVILSNSTRVGLTHRDVNSVCVFLNGMPNIEINRAVPFLNIQFYFAKDPINPITQRLQTLSLPRFLVGADKVENNNATLSALAQAGSLQGKDIAFGQPEKGVSAYATAGMEMFTSPQTLVNADEQHSDILRHTPVLDKFRPMMTIQSFEVTVRPTKGLMSYKTADLSFILHDRSRLAEISEFIRADLYGKNEILIEYGWSHPESSPGNESAYGDLINGMRVKEKYGVVNSSFTFDDQGQAVITLRLAMRGGIEFDTELIASNSDSPSSTIREIEALQKVIGDLREKIYPNTENARVKEVRGVQILDASSDAISRVAFGKDLTKELNAFKAFKNSSPDVTRLREALTQLFDNKTGLVQEVRKTILRDVITKVKKLESSYTLDPWLIKDTDLPEAQQKKGRSQLMRKGTLNEKQRAGRRALAALAATITRAPRRTKAATPTPATPTPPVAGTAATPAPPATPGAPHSGGPVLDYNMGIDATAQCSLAKVMLNFVAEPLAGSGKFDDIQFVFYPFNEYAGYANRLNIANFSVDLSYFIQRLSQYRLEHIGKSGNLSLRGFLDFMADIILDDPAARSYGLSTHSKNNLFKEVPNEDGTATKAEFAVEADQIQAEIKNILSEVTPDGSFKIPKIDFYIEALPELGGAVDGTDSSFESGKTILRIHVFDMNSSSYGSLSALLASTRDAEIEELRSALRTPGGNIGIKEDYEGARASILSAAENSNLIKREAGTDIYQFIGSARETKDFIQRTMPYIMFGAAGTTIKSAQLTSIQDPALASVNILRSFEKEEGVPQGLAPGSLPMRIIPTELNMTTMGCPLINYAQQFFVDFQTGTTADAIYSVVGMTHRFAPGEFTTDIKFTPGDGWGRYISLIDRVNSAVKILTNIEKKP